MFLRKQVHAGKHIFFEIKGMTPFWEKAVENLYVTL